MSNHNGHGRRRNYDSDGGDDLNDDNYVPPDVVEPTFHHVSRGPGGAGGSGGHFDNNNNNAFNNGGHGGGGGGAMQRGVAQPQQFAIQIHPEQQRLNQYLLNEMTKLKKDNKRLGDEVLRLRMENLQLTNRLNALPSSMGLPIEYGSTANTSLLPIQSSSPSNRFPQDLPFVEFDMRRQPPTVQSANVMFCSLLGYTMEEVLGKPWTYFIVDDYVERTVRMLQRESGNKQVQFGQMYKDRNGRPVPAQDLHTFNRDEKGRLVGDYVIVRPEGAPIQHMAAQPMTMFGGVPQTISGKRPVPSIMGGGGDFGTSPVMMDESDEVVNIPFVESPPPLGLSSDPVSFAAAAASGNNNDWDHPLFLWEDDKKM